MRFCFLELHLKGGGTFKGTSGCEAAVVISPPQIVFIVQPTMFYGGGSDFIIEWNGYGSDSYFLDYG